MYKIKIRLLRNKSLIIHFPWHHRRRLPQFLNHLQVHPTLLLQTPLLRSARNDMLDSSLIVHLRNQPHIVILKNQLRSKNVSVSIFHRVKKIYRSVLQKHVSSLVKGRCKHWSGIVAESNRKGESLKRFLNGKRAVFALFVAFNGLSAFFIGTRFVVPFQTETKIVDPNVDSRYDRLTLF